MSQKARSTFVLVHPSEILAALVGLKDVRVLHYERRGPERRADDRAGAGDGPVSDVRVSAPQVKERPVVHYVDLPVYGTPMSLAWKKHRMRCVNPACPKKVLGARRPPHRRQELPADHQGGQVGHGPGRRGPDRLRSGRRTRL